MMAHGSCCHRALLALLLAATAPVPSMAQATDAEFNANWGLAAINGQRALQKGITGAGIDVVVVDEPVQLSHPEFAGRIGPFQSNPGGALDPEKEPRLDHGTQVAGIILAGRNGFGMQGVAPDARLSSIALFLEPAPEPTPENPDPPEGKQLTDAQLAGSYRAAVAAGLRIFNNSWSTAAIENGQITDVTTFTPNGYAEKHPQLLSAFRSAINAGSVIVFATGNERAQDPGVEPGLPFLFPELRPGWIAVTAVDKNLQKADFANACGVAATWCMAAPGVDVFSATPVNMFKRISGTSFAAPHVTGAVALAKQMFPNAEGSQLASIVLRTATDIGDPGIDDIFGWGLLNVGNLVETIDPRNGALFANAAYGRFAAADSLVSTLWERSAQRIMHPGDRVAPVVAQARRVTENIAEGGPAMALGGPPVQDDLYPGVLGPGGSVAWAQGIGAHANIGSGTTSPGASADLGGAIGGYDLFRYGDWRGGISIAWTHSDLDTTSSSDRASSEGWHGFAYATWAQNGWFVDGIAGGNWFDNDYRRTTILGASGTVLAGQGIAGTSSNNTTGVASRLTAGHVYGLGPYLVAPYAYATWLHQRTDGSRESGADIFSLDIDSSTLDQVEGGVGVRGEFGGVVWYGFNVTPAVDLAYGRLGGDVAFPVGFELLGTPIDARATDIGRDVLRVGLQLNVVRLDGMVGAFVSYDCRFQEDAGNNTFSGGLVVRF